MGKRLIPQKYEVIKLSEDFSAYRDFYCWTLVQKVHGVNPVTKQPSVTERFTYHPSLQDMFETMLDRKLGDVETMEEILPKMKVIASELSKVVKAFDEKFFNKPVTRKYR